MIDAGWPVTHAAATMLLLACGSSAIGRSIRDKSSAYAASAHALCDALRQRALHVSTAAPPCYAAVEGLFGLAVADEGWRALLEPLPAGHTFVARAPALACAHPTRVPGVRGSGPVHRLASSACELRDGATIVCFLSDYRGAGDALRSLLQVGPHAYALPPLAEVTLVATLESGAWAHEGATVRRRCVCVRIRTPY